MEKRRRCSSAAALHSSMQEQEGIGLEVELELVQEQERASEEELAQTLCAIAPPVATQNSDEAIAAVAAFMAADGSALLVTPSQHDPFPSAPRRVPSFQPFMEIPLAVVRGISSEAEPMDTERQATDAEIRGWLNSLRSRSASQSWDRARSLAQSALRRTCPGSRATNLAVATRFAPRASDLTCVRAPLKSMHALLSRSLFQWHLRGCCPPDTSCNCRHRFSLVRR